MFYYLLHLYVLLLQKMLVMVFGTTHGQRFGVDQIEMVWIAAVALMPLLYVPCRAFARFKRTTAQQWLRYF